MLRGPKSHWTLPVYFILLLLLVHKHIQKCLPYAFLSDDARGFRSNLLMEVSRKSQIIKFKTRIVSQPRDRTSAADLIRQRVSDNGVLSALL